jgi:hypothetical protein
MMLRNTIDRFGTTEPFECASREDAVARMQPTIRDLAYWMWVGDDDAEMDREEYVTFYATKMSAEFEDGLTEA